MPKVGSLPRALSSVDFRAWRRSYTTAVCSAWTTLRSRCGPTVGVSRPRFLGALAQLDRAQFSASRGRNLRTVFFPEPFPRAATSLEPGHRRTSIIASGAFASTIHFKYPQAVALAMMCLLPRTKAPYGFFCWPSACPSVGRVLLSLGATSDFTRGNTTLGLALGPPFSVVSYGRLNCSACA